MTTRIQKPAIGCAVACSIFTLMTHVAPGAHFKYNLVDDSFQQLWSNTQYWTLISGIDDGANGYPDGSDTFTMDRSPAASNSTRLAIEGGPPFEVAGITGTGGQNRDIVLKFGDFTLGDLEVLESANTFLILSERDKDFTITGVISGAGDLVLERLGGFSDGVDPDELTTITGELPNTITGTIRLYNSSTSGQPSYWVADKVGAFGQTPELTLEGRAGASGVASLRITANANAGEGAIDDDATALFIGAEGVLSIDAGVDEKIGEGKLLVDLAGTGTYTEIPLGTYNNSVDWIIGDGTVTVGAPALPFAITEVDYAPDAEPSPTVTLTWRKTSAASYVARYSTDLSGWGSDLDDGITADVDENPGDADHITVTFPLINGSENATVLFFRIEEG